MALATLNQVNVDFSRLQYKLSYNRGLFNARVDPLPNGFPTVVKTNLSWNGSMLTDENQYIYFFTNDQITEIEAALAVSKALGIHGDLVTQEKFPLPTLRHILQVLCNEVHNGKGFFLLRGLNPDKYSVEDFMVIFLGIQSYIAEQRARQDDMGNMVVHIISDDSAAFSSASRLHARHSRKSITFHTEETGDIIAWQTRNTAARGGSCIISSSETIYNILATTRPDIVRTLAEPDWPFALPDFHYRAILFYHASHLIINFCRAALLGSAAYPRPRHLPSLTNKQREALDVLESVARGVELKIATQPGDVHFVNNLAVLHRRDDFIDDDGESYSGGHEGEDRKKKRHLVRMRIRNEKLRWDLPQELEGEWKKAFGDEGERFWHLEPMPEGFFPLRLYPN